jgi:hypothetical protein
MDDERRFILRNIADRPVELHGPSGVSIIPPDAVLELSETDPQLELLIAAGVLSREKAGAPSGTGDDQRGGRGPGDTRSGRAKPAASGRKSGAGKSSSSGKSGGSATPTGEDK